jgi:hypothetical protein
VLVVEDSGSDRDRADTYAGLVNVPANAIDFSSWLRFIPSMGERLMRFILVLPSGGCFLALSPEQMADFEARSDAADDATCRSYRCEARN